MRAVKCANCIADDSERRAIGLLHGSNLSTSIVCHSLWCDGNFVWSTNTKASKRYNCYGETMSISSIAHIAPDNAIRKNLGSLLCVPHRDTGHLTDSLCEEFW